MLKIRREQVEVLAAPLVERFVRETAERAAARFPEKHEELGEDGLENLVRHAMTRAENHGFSRDSHLREYINLAMAFGRDFDDLPWAREQLSRPGGAGLRMARLQAEALLHEDASAESESES